MVTKVMFGKSKRGLIYGGLSPNISEKFGEILPGKLGLFGADWGLCRVYRGLFEADRDQFLRTSQQWGRAEIAPKSVKHPYGSYLPS